MKIQVLRNAIVKSCITCMLAGGVNNALAAHSVTKSISTNYMIIGESSSIPSKNVPFSVWPLTSSNKSYVGTGYYNKSDYSEYTATGFTSGCVSHFTVFGYLSQQAAKEAKFSISYSPNNGGTKNCLTRTHDLNASTAVPGSGEGILFSPSRYGRVVWVEEDYYGAGTNFCSTTTPSIKEYFTKACNGTYTIKDTVHTNMPVFKLHFKIQ